MDDILERLKYDVLIHGHGFAMLTPSGWHYLPFEQVHIETDAPEPTPEEIAALNEAFGQYTENVMDTVEAGNAFLSVICKTGAMP